MANSSKYDWKEKLGGNKQAPQTWPGLSKPQGAQPGAGMGSNWNFGNWKPGAAQGLGGLQFTQKPSVQGVGLPSVQKPAVQGGNILPVGKPGNTAPGVSGSGYQNGRYTESDAVRKAQAAYQQQAAGKPGAYQSQWQTQIDDIIGKIMQKYTHMDLGNCLIIVGTLVALSSAFAYDGKTVVISLLGSYLGGVVLDKFMNGFAMKRRVTIVSNHEKELVHFIIHDLHSGASIYQFYGAYHMEVRREVVAIVDRREYQILMNYIRKTDPDALLTVYQVSDMHYRPKGKTVQ